MKNQDKPNMQEILRSFDASLMAGLSWFVQHLSVLFHGTWPEEKRQKVLERALSNEGEGITAYASYAGPDRAQSAELHLTSLLRAQRAIYYRHKHHAWKCAAAEVFVLWGINMTPRKVAFRTLQRLLGRPLLIVEDGFIRSIDIGLSGAPGLSIILGDTTAYYDATQPSRLQRLLETGPDLTPAQTQRARKAIDAIVAKRVSKYNHAPNLPVHIGTPGRKKLLLIDQRFGDQSVASGLASEATFERMLVDALQRVDCEVVVKQHPDTIKGGKSSYFSDARLANYHATGRLFPIRHDVNPYALLAVVDEIYVATSGMGFEALMAGKTVHCYGMPFYAGWGATLDRLTLPERTRQRAVEDIFHYAYITCSRYYHPERKQLVEVEELVDYIASMCER